MLDANFIAPISLFFLIVLANNVNGQPYYEDYEEEYGNGIEEENGVEEEKEKPQKRLKFSVA